MITSLSTAMILVPTLWLSLQSNQATATVLDLDMFPDGSPVPTDAVLTDQYRDIGVLIDGRRPGQEPGSLSVISAGSPGGGRFLFFSPDIEGAIAIFRFVAPGSDIATTA